MVVSVTVRAIIDKEAVLSTCKTRVSAAGPHLLVARLKSIGGAPAREAVE
jgi:hypothetical protein